MRLCLRHHTSLASIRSPLGSLSGVSVVLLEEENSAESLNEDDSEWDYDDLSALPPVTAPVKCTSSTAHPPLSYGYNNQMGY